LLQDVVGLEDRFIDLAFEAGEVQGMTPDDIKGYIRFIADWRLRQLGLPTVYDAKETPCPGCRASYRVSSTPTFSRRDPPSTPRPRPAALGMARRGMVGIRADDLQADGYQSRAELTRQTRSAWSRNRRFGR